MTSVMVQRLSIHVIQDTDPWENVLLAYLPVITSLDGIYHLWDVNGPVVEATVVSSDVLNLSYYVSERGITSKMRGPQSSLLIAITLTTRRMRTANFILKTARIVFLC